MSSAAKIPVIDISATGEHEQAQVAKELVEAAVEHGFVYIRNTGADIPVEAVENAFELVRCETCPTITIYAESQLVNAHNRATRYSRRPSRKSKNVSSKRITGDGRV